LFSLEQIASALDTAQALVLIDNLAEVRTAFEESHSSLADAVAGVLSGPLKGIFAMWCAVSPCAAAAPHPPPTPSILHFFWLIPLTFRVPANLLLPTSRRLPAWLVFRSLRVSSRSQHPYPLPFQGIFSLLTFQAGRLVAEQGQLLAENSLLLTTLSIVSPAQLRAISHAFTKETGISISAAVAKEASADDAQLVFVIETAALDVTDIAADALKRSMEGWGTDESALNWLIISRRERDLAQVKASYQQRHGTALENDIKGDTSDDFEKLLLALL
jgi:hypothetical protein